MSYVSILDHLFLAFDLYETNKSEEATEQETEPKPKKKLKLTDNRNFNIKLNVYIDKYRPKLIAALCDQTDDDAIELINGLLRYSDTACSFILSKPVVTSYKKDEIYQRYLEFILLPILVACIKLLCDFRDCSPFIVHLNTILRTTDEEGVTPAARKMLRNILKAEECAPYRDGLLEYVSTLKSGNQRRKDINNKIKEAEEYCDQKNLQEKNKSLDTLQKFHDAYIACRTVIYLHLNTGLVNKLVALYKVTTDRDTASKEFKTCNNDIYLICASIVDSILIQATPQQPLPATAINILDKLWKLSLKDIPKVKEPYFEQNIKTLFYLLDENAFEIFKSELIDYKKSEQFFNIADSFEEFNYLKPYIFMLEVVYHIQHNFLQKALDILASKDAQSLIDNTIGPLPYYASMIFIGLSIKLRPNEIKQDTFNPFVNLIINNQQPYSHPQISDATILKLKFESNFSDSYSQTILHSINNYNSFVVHATSHLTLPLVPERYTRQMILDAWGNVEVLLAKVCKAMENSKNKYKPILTKQEQKKLLIPYLPKSTLYNCVRELNLLVSFLILIPEHYPFISKIFYGDPDIPDPNDQFNIAYYANYRKRVLEAINPEQFQTESEDYKKKSEKRIRLLRLLQ